MQKLIVVLFLTLALAGCSLSPGMLMDDPRLSKASHVPPPDVPDVDIIEVTTEVIRQQSTGYVNSVRRGSNRGFSTSKRNYHYHIGPGDVLSITVWEHPELTIPAGEFRSADSSGNLVSEEGTIFFPFAGVLKVVGRTIGEVRNMITRGIQDEIANPQVDVRVAAFRSQKAYVVGEVAKPGVQPINDVPLTILDAINAAGGVTNDADRTNVTLTRGKRIAHINLIELYEDAKLGQNYLMRHGDVLNVADRLDQKVFVIGEVDEPASVLMHERRMSLAEAISDVGGLDRVTSNPERVYIIRASTQKPQIYHLNMRSPDALLLGEQFALLPRDVVYVETAGIARWNRVISQILPSAQTLNQIGGSGRPFSTQN